MLKSLYDYATLHQLALPEGYAKKTVAAFIWFSSANPGFIEIFHGDDEPIPCPDIGSLANGKDKSNIIVEKRSVVIPEVENAKSRFFLEALSAFGELDADARLCAQQLTRPEVIAVIRQKLDGAKVKPANRISFRVDDRNLCNSPKLLEWWKGFRRELLPPASGEIAPCLITGELTNPVTTVAPINGLHAVGGHARGDALICFDKPAFCSYGQKQAANAPVSEAAIGAVKAALDYLLVGAPTLAGMKFVHWYEREISREEDPFFEEDIFGFAAEEDDAVNEEAGPSADQEKEKEKDMQAVQAADRLVSSIRSGEHAATTDFAYHILLLTGVGGRVMVRRYERGSYSQLCAALKMWEQDLALVNPYGTGICKSLKLAGRMIRLLSYQKNDREIFKRMAKELAGVSPAVLTAILSGGPLPDTVAARALAYIRSRMLASEEESDNLDGWACQWLKVWLCRRNERSDTMLKETYNPAHPEAAYHCGSLMAVYAAIQSEAMPEVNVSVVQRYYASCIQAPKLVLGQLSKLNVHHLAKLKDAAAKAWRIRLGEVNTAIGDVIPTTLNLEKQSYFALGYYQMLAHIRQERLARHAEKNVMAEQEEV